MNDLDHVTELLERDPQAVNGPRLRRVNLTVGLQSVYEGFIHDPKQPRVKTFIVGVFLRHTMDLLDAPGEFRRMQCFGLLACTAQV